MAYPVVVPAQQAVEAANAAPVNAAADQAKIAQSKATAETAPLAADDQMLQRLGPAVLENPKSPQLRALLEPILARRGQAWPEDPAQLSNMLSPIKPWSQWTPDEITAQRKLPPWSRTLPPDAPKEARQEPQYIPMTDVDQRLIYSQIDQKEKELGTGNYRPEVFLADLLSAKKRLAAGGASTEGVDSYLSADGQSLNEGFKDKFAGDFAEAKIKELDALGVHLKDEDATKEALRKDKRAEFDKTLKYDYYKTNTEATVQSRKLEVAMGNLNARWASVANSQYSNALKGQGLAFNIYKAQLGAAQKEFEGAQKQLQQTTATLGSIANGANGAQEIGKPYYQSLQQQALDLKKFLDTNGAELQARQSDALQGIAHVSQSITGHDTSAPKNPEGFSFFKTTPDGKHKIWTNKDNTKYWIEGTPTDQINTIPK